ncbi:hypothetical protein [Zhongshania aliphaticivorans]|uniref:hypothetical protein n=1 Tax=Zhongshania aliphaticivorans TaxID=1470434 RepID=UPI0012E4FB5D|nr:hypothetical protein [Zhongshania aliphaticivorans]CAA0108567.1 Uncharacterised protein [Zhongshania aliphaticivorans]
MNKFRGYLIAVVDLVLIAVAFGGLLLSCSNHESERQAAEHESELVQRVVYQSPLDTFLRLDDTLWQQVLQTPGYFNDGNKGLLLDVRYWEEKTDVIVEKIRQAGYTVDYINPANQRIYLWAKSAEQLVALSRIYGVSVISISRSAPKMAVAIKVFDELQK